MSEIDIPVFNIGCLTGISEEDALEKYPKDNQSMQDWRDGKIDISELNINGMGCPIDFYRNCIEVVDKLKKQDCIFVGTRSVLTGLASVMLYRRPEKGGGYYVISWGNADIASFTYTQGKFKFEEDRSSLNINP